jgi:hypothetical protein
LDSEEVALALERDLVAEDRVMVSDCEEVQVESSLTLERRARCEGSKERLEARVRVPTRKRRAEGKSREKELRGEEFR